MLDHLVQQLLAFFVSEGWWCILDLVGELLNLKDHIRDMFALHGRKPFQDEYDGLLEMGTFSLKITIPEVSNQT